MNAGMKLVRQLLERKAPLNNNVNNNNNVVRKLKQRKARRTPLRAISTGPSGEGNIRVRDTEKFNMATANAVVVSGFPVNLTRLQAFAKMYEKYMIHSIQIRVLGIAGSAQDGQVYIGITSGPNDTRVKTAKDLLAMKPSRVLHASGSTIINLTHDIQLSKYMRCDDDDAFTLYYWVTKADVAYIEMSYDVTFSSPRPF